MQYQFRARVFSFFVILSMLLAAMGFPTQSAFAANAGMALQFDGTTANRQHVTFGAPPVGTLVGTPTWTTTANSKFGASALQFNGSSQYASTGTGTTLNTATFTVETWFFRTGPGVGVTTGGSGIALAIPLLTKGTSEGETTGADINYFLGIDATSAKLVADFEEGAGGASPSLNHPITGTTTIVDNTWYHAAATYDGNKWQLFLNGNLEAELVVGRPANAVLTSPMALATSIRSNGTTIQGYFAGRLDEARVWSYARSQAEIQGTMNAEIIHSEPGLMARYGMNEGTGTSTYSQHPLGVTTFTLEAWVKRAADGGVSMSTGTDGFDNVGGRPNIYPVVTRGMGEGESPARVNTNYFLGITTTGVIGADFEDKATGGNHPVWGNTVISTDEWHHLAATYTGTCWALYLDGNAETLNGTVCPNAIPESISIQHAGLAASLNSTGGLGAGFFSGTIDEVRVWNRALSATEVNGNKLLELTSSNGLLARWGVNEGSGTFVNSSVSAIHGTVKSNTTIMPAWVTGFPIPDSIPPAAPTGLSAAGGDTIVSLSWTANVEPDLAGYNLYRGTTPGGPYAKVNTAIISSTSYFDTGLTNGTRYYYILRAVDTSTNESANSGEVTATAAALATSLSFDGDGDYVTFGEAPGLGLTDFTLETWFYWTGGGVATTTSSTQGLSSVIPLITKGRGEDDGNSKDMNFFLGVVPGTRTLAADFEDMGSGMNHPFTGSATISIDEWHHAAVTYDSTTAVWSLYLDGVLDSTSDLGSNILPRSDSIQHAGLGSAMTSAGAAAGYFQGRLDEARIWNVARTATQIRNAANLQLTSGTGLVARWGMGEGAGTVITSSVGSFNGTLTGNTTFIAGAPFNLVFDTTPPAAPTNLVSSPRPGAVQLEWTVNTEPDLAGYRVYRSTTSPVVKGTPINGTLIAPSFMDSGVTEGITYYYAVTAVDASGNESGLSNETSAIPLAPPPPEALNLGSSNAYISFGDPAALDLAQFTIETWFKRTGAGIANTTGNGGIASAIPLVTHGAPQVDNSDNMDANWMLVIDDASDVIAADFEDMTNGSNHPVLGVTPITNNAWHHAAATYDGTTWRLYLDGNLERTLTVNAAPRSDTIQRAGLGTMIESDGATNGFFNGTLDEVRVWNYARTQAEIASAINTKLAAPQTGLVARWGLDEGTGTAVNDSSGSDITGTITGTGSSWVPGSPFNVTVNLPPDAPTLPAPADGATNVAISPTLSVDVSDPEGQPLDVTFYGRPKQSAAGPDFTVAIIPDAQYYASTYPAIYNAQMDWIAANKTTENIVFVGSLGDNVDVYSNTTQWTNAVTAWNKVDVAGLPYGLAAGNHDGAPSSTANFNTNFGLSRFGGKAWYGGHYGSDNDNHYALFSASGLDFIALFIEYDGTMTSANHAVLDWADSVLKSNSTRRAIVISHNMLQGGSSAAFSTQGQAIYDALKDNPNLFLMMGGHLDVAARRTDTFNGSTVYTLRSDYQSVDSQQSGYLRLMRFSPSDDMIYVRTYSPTQNKDYDKSDAAQNNFNLAYAMDGTGFSVIGTAYDVPSGTTASVSWTELDFSEQYEWFVIASDGTHQISSNTWSFTTASANTAPAANADQYQVDEGTPLTIAAPGVLDNDADAESNPLTAALVTGPAHGTLTLNADGSFSYTPAAGYTGTDSFTYTASDGSLDSNTATVTITVNPGNDTPVAIGDRYDATEDTQLSIDASGVLGNDTDSDPLTAILVSGPSHGSLTLNTNGSFSYTPAANYNGADSFTYKANDGSLDSNTVTVTINITAVNDAPVANAQNISTDEDTLTPLVITLTGSDVEGGSLIYAVIDNPDHGNLTGTAPNLSYTPNANYNGPDSFSFQVNDGSLNSNIATVAITVNAINDIPAAAADVYATPEDTSLDVAAPGVLGNDSDLDGDPLTAILVNGPSHGTLTLNADGSFSYQPEAAFSGEDSFTYKASDGTAESNTTSVTIAVSSVNDPVVCNNFSLNTAEDNAVQADPACSDPEGLTFTISVITPPAHGTLQLIAGKFLYTPQADFFGADSFTYKANDGQDSNTATAAVTVTAVNDAPVAETQSVATLENTPKAIMLTGSDVENTTLTFTVVDSPAYGSLTGSAPDLLYTPETNYFGPDSFTFTVSDGMLESALATISITVDQENPPPPPSSFYGQIHINDNPPVVGGTIQAFVPGVTEAVASAQITQDTEGYLVYSIVVRGDDGIEPKEGGVEGDIVTLKINHRVVATGVWHSGSDDLLNIHPPAPLPGGPYSGNEGSSIALGPYASDWGGDYNIFQWDWNNDGIYDTAGQYLDHTWTQDGVYTVGLKVTDFQGGEGVITFGVTVHNAAPTADAHGPYNGIVNSAISFEGTASDPGADTLLYEWDFDYNGTTFQADTSGQTLSHTYTVAGSYTVALRVSDDDASTIDTAQVMVLPENVPPQIIGQVVLTTDEDIPITITLADLLVTDPDNAYPTGFSLTLQGGANYTLAGNTITPAHNFHGDLSVPVKVNDGEDDSNLFSLKVTVNDLLPTNVEAGGPYTGTAGQSITLNGSAACPSVDTCTLAWDLDNDGQYDDGFGAVAYRSWNNAGDYIVGLRVQDEDGNPVTDTASVHINAATHSLALLPGWNLVSFNLHPLDTNIASVLSSLEGNYSLVYAWDATGAHAGSGNWVKYNPTAPVYQNSLLNLDETMGFWIRMTAADTLEVTGNIPGITQITLSDNASGWNLVGFPSRANWDLPGVVSNFGVGTDYSLIYSYHAGDTADPWRLFNRTGLPYGNDLTQLSPGWGYWIKVNADHTWTVYDLP